MSLFSKARTEDDVKVLTETEFKEVVKAAVKSNPKATIFTSSSNNSRYVFSNGKSVNFVKRIYVTEDTQEINELRASTVTCTILSEYKPEATKQTEVTKSEETNPEVTKPENNQKAMPTTK